MNYNLKKIIDIESKNIINHIIDDITGNENITSNENITGNENITDNKNILN